MNANELANNQLTHVIGDTNAGEEVVITLRKPLYPESFVRQQQAEIEALKDFAIWMTGCGYDFCQHEYFIKCRDELLIGKAQEK